MEEIEDPIIIEQVFNTNVENLWEAITVLDKMKQWFFEAIESFEPVVGFETNFVIQIEDRLFPHLWKIIEVEENKKIVYDWSYDGYPGKSIVTFELFEDGADSKIILTATVLEPFPNNILEFKRENGIDGWNYFIRKRLKEFLEEYS